MPQSDWTVSVDELICQRLSPCLLCGSRRIARADLHTIGGTAVTVMLCAACHRRDRDRLEVQAKLKARYVS